MEAARRVAALAEGQAGQAWQGGEVRQQQQQQQQQDGDEDEAGRRQKGVGEAVARGATRRIPREYAGWCCSCWKA